MITSRAPIKDAPLPLGPLSREIGPALVGSKLGHFRLDEFIGGGGMGVVFRAHDQSLDRSVAVKVLSQQQTEESLRRFRNEAQSAARLDHPNIARVYYVGEDRGWNYIVFEYIEGVNVRDLVAHKGPLPIDEVVSYTLQIASAIEHAWKRNVIHRDIKPSNILVQEDGQAKLVDMGLARLHHDPVSAPNQDLTASGMTLGTFDYISPEQARDPREADVRSDLYSLGCTIYYMLTGQPPFPEGTVLQKLLSHSSENPADPRDFRPDIPPSLASLLERLLAKRPSDRHQTPEELIAALLFLAEELGTPLADPLWRHRVRFAPHVPTWWERSIPWLVALALLATVAIFSEWFPHGVSDVPLPVPQVASPDAVDPGKPPTATPEDRPAVPENTTSPAIEADQPELPVTRLDPGEAGDASDTSNEPLEADTTSRDDARDSRPLNPTVLQVGPFEQEGSASGGFTTLAAALEYAATHETVKEIVLAWDGIQTLPPQLRVWSEFRGREMTLRAAAGHRVVLAVTPEDTTGTLGSEPAMIRLTDSRWTFADIQWEWHLDPHLQPREAWSMFALTGGTEATWKRCAITVSNVDEQGYQVHPNVAIFRVAPLPSSEMIPDDRAPIAAVAPQLWLEQCMVRGEAVLLAHQSSQSLLLSWRQGVLATTDRAITIDAHADLASASTARIELMFENVLLLTAGGLVLTRQSPLSGQLPELALHLVHCVVVVEQAEPPVAVFEQRGVERDRWRPPEFTGGRNRYGNTDVSLRLLAQDVSESVEEFALERLRMKPPSWFGEELPQPLPRNPWIPWPAPPSRMSKAALVAAPDQHRALQLLQYDDEDWESIPEPAGDQSRDSQ